MAQALFCLAVLFETGMLIIPLTSASRGRAIWGWLVNFLASSMLFPSIKVYFPSWVEPHWHNGLMWALLAWTLFISGFIAAIRKPRKRDLPVA